MGRRLTVAGALPTGTPVSRFVAARLADAEREWLAWSLTAMRERLRGDVRFVSPVLVDVVDREGLDVDAVVAMMVPGWEHETGALGIRAGRGRRVRWNGRKTLTAGLSSRLDVDGRVIRGRFDVRGSLAIAVADGFLDLVVDLPGGAVLTTCSDAGELVLPCAIPHVVASACVGQPIDRLVASPLFFGRGYVVTAADVAGPRRTVLTIDVGRVAYSVPW